MLTGLRRAGTGERRERHEGHGREDHDVPHAFWLAAARATRERLLSRAPLKLGLCNVGRFANVWVDVGQRLAAELYRQKD